MDILIVFVLAWLVCGVLTAVVANAKHRNAPGWLLIGALTGVLGLIAIAGMPASTAEPSEPKLPRRSKQVEDRLTGEAVAVLYGGFAVFGLVIFGAWLLGV